jgi:hypothetical protein
MPNDIEKPDGEKHIIAGSNHLRWSKVVRWDEIRCEFFANKSKVGVNPRALREIDSLVGFCDRL